MHSCLLQVLVSKTLQLEKGTKMADIDFSKLDWYRVLSRFGFEPGPPKKHTICPIEQDGKLRFRFDNKNGRGEWICSNCGAGDGVRLVALLQGCDEREAAIRIKYGTGDLSNVVAIRPTPQKKEPDIRWIVNMLEETWAGGVPLAGTPALRYVQRRVPNLDPRWLSADLRYHPQLRHQDAEDKVQLLPGMIAMVRDITGEPVNIHRTYLTADGHKAALEPDQIKKLMTGTRKLNGEVIVLNQGVLDTRIVLVSEGIETGLALVAAYQNRYQVEAAVNAGNLAKYKPVPGQFDLVVFYSDNDPINPRTGENTGLASARKAALNLKNQGQGALVRMPSRVGVDYADLWLEKCNGVAKRIAA